MMGKGFLLCFVAVIAHTVLVKSQTSKQTRQAIAREVYHIGIRSRGKQLKVWTAGLQ